MRESEGLIANKRAGLEIAFQAGIDFGPLLSHIGDRFAAKMER